MHAQVTTWVLLILIGAAIVAYWASLWPRYHAQKISDPPPRGIITATIVVMLTMILLGFVGKLMAIILYGRAHCLTDIASDGLGPLDRYNVGNKLAALCTMPPFGSVSFCLRGPAPAAAENK